MSAPPQTTRRHAAVATAAIALAGASFSCSGGRRAAPKAAPAAPALEAAATGRTVVAEVNGNPIYGDCVATQARAHHLGRPDALGECIDFELLAQAAARRGYAARPAVRETRTTEMVRALIEHDFSPQARSPAEVPDAQLQAAWNKIKRRFNHPEYRAAYCLRAPVGRHAAANGAADQRARALVFEIYDALRGEHNLTVAEFKERAKAIAGKRKLAVAGRFRFPLHSVVAFAQAAFALPQAGMVATPTRGARGWQIALLTKIFPAEHKPLAAVENKLRSDLYLALGRKQFLAWVHKLSNGYSIKVNPQGLSHAQASGPLSAPAGGG